MRVRRAASLALLVALAAAPALAGCSSIEQVVEGATGGKLDFPGQSVPRDFPAEVPLIEGEVIFGAGVDDPDSPAWNVTVKVTGADPADTVRAQLEDAGFVASPDGPSVGSASTLLYSDAAYSVAVIITGDGAGDTAEGFVVNYTVTRAEAQ